MAGTGHQRELRRGQLPIRQRSTRSREILPPASDVTGGRCMQARASIRRRINRNLMNRKARRRNVSLVGDRRKTADGDNRQPHLRYSANPNGVRQTRGGPVMGAYEGPPSPQKGPHLRELRTRRLSRERRKNRAVNATPGPKREQDWSGRKRKERGQGRWPERPQITYLRLLGSWEL